MKLKVKNWEEFQHYKDRAPPWIKFHKKLLDDFEFHKLPVDSRALAPCLWLLASEDLEGIISMSVDEVAFRLRQTSEQITAALQPLIAKGFFIVMQDDSIPLAERKHAAIPETEAEAYKEEAETLSGKPDGAQSAKKNGNPNHGVAARQILAFLNDKAGKNFHATQANMGFIVARLREGATETECRQVIVRKCREWKNTEQAKYLRPETLFNATKFGSYQGELVTDVPRETLQQ